MERNDLEKAILAQHPELLLTNLKKLRKPYLDSWLQNNQITLPASVLVKIFSERNERAEINLRLRRANFGLEAKLNSLTDWSKSEIIQGFKNLFGNVAKADDRLLSEIGAISKETALEDLEKAEKIVDDALHIVKQFRRKYGNLIQQDRELEGYLNGFQETVKRIRL